MSDVQRYLAEEIALDCRDGFTSRREALRRLTLLGVGSAAAAALLAGCKDNPSAPAAGAGGAGGGASPGPGATAALPASAVTFAGPEGRTLQAAYAGAAKARGAVLVIHENRGLTDHFRTLAGRFAGAGYSALALDLLSAEGGTASLGDPANATAALGKAPPERFVADMRAGLDELARRAPGLKLGAIGFCFGGGMMWRLVAAKDPRVAAAAPFYGPLPEGADFAGSKAAVLGVYAENDARVNASRDAAKAALERAGLAHEIVTYPGVDHAFFNDTGPRHNGEAAAKAWAKVLEWFGRHVG
ncbi:MAG TPA: dienelactone hydrolase family protein [Polyangiaceae bacterium]|nr:dienelactone hydrolase family protein [Polyangiaceae bacterium]